MNTYKSEFPDFWNFILFSNSKFVSFEELGSSIEVVWKTNRDEHFQYDEQMNLH